MAIPSKAGIVDANGALKVSLAANTDVASEIVTFGSSATPTKLPDTPLANRRTFLVAFPTDNVFMGDATVSEAAGYVTRGTERESGWNQPSARSEYSNRKQFLRGQYVMLRITDDIDFYVLNEGAIEQAVGFELS